MHEIFKQNVDEFLDSVRDRVRQLVGSPSLQERQTAGYRYWWLADNDEDKDAYPQLWFETRSAEIVNPGKLNLTAVAPSASSDQLRRVPGVAKQPALRDYCKPGGGGKWSLFTVLISYGEESPIEIVAKPLADILVAMREAYQGLR